MGKNSPIMSAADKRPGLEVHSQYINPDTVPDNQVIAISSRLYRESWRTKKIDTLEQKCVEVLQINDNSFGSQLHPEIEPWLLYVMSYFPK